MADFKGMKNRKNSLGTPPPPEEASDNLNAPEVAPAAAEEAKRTRPDLRSARKTNRTIPFATRVSPEFDEKIREIAGRDGLKLVEILEQALALYEINNATK